RQPLQQGRPGRVLVHGSMVASRFPAGHRPTAGERRGVAVPDDQHFGAGENSPVPSRPGPDPWRLWLYGGGVLLALVTFCGGIIVLNQRKG
ncbi:hypothetical protein ABZ297_45920, partial [Nonomuraea sp. NPDC005983]